MATQHNISKRTTGSWFSTDMPLSSKRARIILSSPKDAKAMVAAVRSLRHGESGRFVISKKVRDKLKLEEEKSR